MFNKVTSKQIALYHKSLNSIIKNKIVNQSTSNNAKELLSVLQLSTGNYPALIQTSNVLMKLWPSVFSPHLLSVHLVSVGVSCYAVKLCLIFSAAAVSASCHVISCELSNLVTVSVCVCVDRLYICSTCQTVRHTYKTLKKGADSRSAAQKALVLCGIDSDLQRGVILIQLRK